MGATVAAQAAFSSGLVFFVSGCETGARFFCELAQHILFAQQPGLHDFWTGASDTMQVLAET